MGLSIKIAKIVQFTYRGCESELPLLLLSFYFHFLPFRDFFVCAIAKNAPPARPARICDGQKHHFHQWAGTDDTC
jgi:hypothetical protein